jgi:hypothetical protein
MQYTLSEYLKAINYTKLDLIRDGDKDSSAYPIFIIYACLAGIDTLLLVNEINTRSNASVVMVNDFLLAVVPKKKNRYNPLEKRERNSNIELIMRVYNYNRQKAIAASNILTESQVNELKDLYGTDSRT